MTGKRNTVGLALLTIIAGAIAFSAMSAPASSPPKFHFGKITYTYLTATQSGTNQLDTAGGNIKCSAVSLSSTYSESTVTEGIFSASYSGCTAFGLTAHIDTMGCTYRFTNSEVIHLECPAGNEITVTPTAGGVPVCHVDIPPQTLNATYANVAGTPDDMTVTPAAEPVIKYTVTPTDGTTKCGTEGVHSDGRYTGITTVRAYQDVEHKEQVELTYN